MSPGGSAALPRLALGVALVVLQSAIASEPLQPQAAVETRQAAFKKMGAALKTLTDQLKGTTPESAKLAASARAIAAGAQELPLWFPAGSGPDAGMETDALPNIWTDRTRFDALSQDLIADARALLAATDSGDLDAVRAQVKRVGATCSTCHRSFRAD